MSQFPHQPSATGESFELFVLCHEGEIPYVVASLKDALYETPGVQIVGQGSTEKLYMGYVLLQGEGEPSTALIAELRANPDVYLYAFHTPDVQGEESAEADAEEAFPWWSNPVPVES